MSFPPSGPAPDGERAGSEPPVRFTLVQVDRWDDRPGWVVVSLAESFVDPAAIRVLSSTLIDLFVDDIDIDTVTVDASRCAALGPAACHVLVDAARHARSGGGCLVASGVDPEARLSLASYDVDNRLDVARTR